MSTMVLGGGYAGVMAANRLASNGETVTLVTPSPWFVERIRLHAVAAGLRGDARVPLAALVDARVAVMDDRAVRIADDGVLLASGERLDFETLVYAVGSGGPGDGRAHHVATLDGARRLRAALVERPDAAVTVVGAGLTGIELAAALRVAGRTVRLVTATVPDGRATRTHLLELERLGVRVETGRTVDVDGLVDDGRDIVVAATGFTASSLATDSDLPTDAHGRLVVDEHLTVPGAPRILGAGDGVHVLGRYAAHLRPACATAMPLGAHAADVVRARRDGVRPAPFTLGYVARCVDLGGGRGHVQLVRGDDSERRVAVTGRAGGLVKEGICRMTLRWLAAAQRYSWSGRVRPVRAVEPVPSAQ